jgi:hypothetical protein
MSEDVNKKQDDFSDMEGAFGDWVNELEKQKQPTCNIDNPDDCEACGS